MTKCIKRIRDLIEYALYKFTLYLLTYLLTHSPSYRRRAIKLPQQQRYELPSQ